jgi:hypothetical protein
VWRSAGWAVDNSKNMGYELLLARACAASNSFFVVLLFGPRVMSASLRLFLFGPRVMPASLRFFLTLVVPASLRFFLFGPNVLPRRAVPPLLCPAFCRCAPVMGFLAFFSCRDIARKFADRSDAQFVHSMLAVVDRQPRGPGTHTGRAHHGSQPPRGQGRLEVAEAPRLQPLGRGAACVPASQEQQWH